MRTKGLKQLPHSTTPTKMTAIDFNVRTFCNRFVVFSIAVMVVNTKLQVPMIKI